MNKITSLFSLAGLLALTSCTLDPVTDINAMEEAVLARQNELAAEMASSNTYTEGYDDDHDEQEGSENEQSQGGYEDSSSSDENESAQENEQNEGSTEAGESNDQDSDSSQAIDSSHDNNSSQVYDSSQDNDSSQDSDAQSADNDSSSNNTSAQQTGSTPPAGVSSTAWTAIQSHLAQHFSAASVVKVEQEDGEIEVKLNTGQEVYFTLNGTHIRTEN
jgi:hypothetical protein